MFRCKEYQPEANYVNKFPAILDGKRVLLLSWQHNAGYALQQREQFHCFVDH